MPKFEFEFWQCGHVTRISDGIIICADGNLDRLPKDLVPRDLIKKRLGDRCHKCYTERVLYRLRSLRPLLFGCHTQQEAVKMADHRVSALIDFMSSDPSGKAIAEDGGFENYPFEFGVMMDHIVELSIEVHTAALADLKAAHDRIRTRVPLPFLVRIDEISRNAQAFFREGNHSARECMAVIIHETDRLRGEIKENEAEELLLIRDFELKITRLKALFDEFKANNSMHYERIKP